MAIVKSLVCLALLAATLVNAHPSVQNSQQAGPSTNEDVVILRIEGLTTTIFEGPIQSAGGNVTTPSGGTHLCNGLNLGANPLPGPTCTTALAAAAKKANFPFDGTYETQFQDFFIMSIGGLVQTSTKFWGLLLNYNFTPVGGCQQETIHDQEVLWAYDAFNAVHFLKALPPSIHVKKGAHFNITITDGGSGTLISGATINGVLTDAHGNAVLSFAKKGVYTIKAERLDSIRSNAVYVHVE